MSYLEGVIHGEPFVFVFQSVVRPGGLEPPTSRFVAWRSDPDELWACDLRGDLNGRGPDSLLGDRGLSWLRGTFWVTPSLGLRSRYQGCVARPASDTRSHVRPLLAGWRRCWRGRWSFCLSRKIHALPRHANPLNEIPEKLFEAARKPALNKGRQVYENKDWYACRASSRRVCAHTRIVRVSWVMRRR